MKKVTLWSVDFIEMKILNKSILNFDKILNNIVQNKTGKSAKLPQKLQRVIKFFMNLTSK